MEKEKQKQKLDDSTFAKTIEQIREEYKEKYGEYPKPLTDKEKKEYGLLK